MIRVDAVLSIVGVCTIGAMSCFAQDGDCFEANNTPGCEDPKCTAAVCEIDSFCCDSFWDDSCVEYAKAVDACVDSGQAGDCDKAVTIELGEYSFDTTGSTEVFDLDGFCDPGQFGDDALHQVIWYRWECTKTSRYVLSTCSQASFDTRLAVLAETCEPINVVACLDDTEGCLAFSTEISFNATAGTTYIMCVGGFGPGYIGTGTLTLAEAEREFVRTVSWLTDLGAPVDTNYTLWRPVDDTWNGCLEEATAAGEQLASIHSAEENDVIANLFTAAAPGGHAIGLVQDRDASDYAEPAGGWTWTDGTPLTFTAWQDGEPNNTNDNEDVGQMVGGGLWNDSAGDSTGVTGYVVKEEGPPFSYTWTEEEGGNGHRYEAFALPVPMSIVVAQAYAESRGGYLVTITSVAEQVMLLQKVLPFMGVDSGIGIGLVQNTDSPDYSEPSGGWEWVTGEPVSFTFWNTGEPNDTPAGENYVEMYSSGRWNDVLTTSNCIAVIIEYETTTPPCPGDLNGDQVVNGADLTILLGAWGSKGGLADLDGNNFVNGADLTILLSGWGLCP